MLGNPGRKENGVLSGSFQGIAHWGVFNSELDKTLDCRRQDFVNLTDPVEIVIRLLFLHLSPPYGDSASVLLSEP